MSDIIIGTKILVINGEYKSNTGTVVEIHRDDWDGEDHYSVILDQPAAVIIDFHGQDLTFHDQRAFLANAKDIKPLTKMGEAIYGGTLEKGDLKTL